MCFQPKLEQNNLQIISFLTKTSPKTIINSYITRKIGGFMKKILTCVFAVCTILFLSNSTIACENCNCKCKCEKKCECVKNDCKCGCQDKKCNCENCKCNCKKKCECVKNDCKCGCQNKKCNCKKEESTETSEKSICEKCKVKKECSEDCKCSCHSKKFKLFKKKCKKCSEK